ncbi:MAG: hypothetical protein ABFD04_07035 [Syntrophomonas sp.]
MKRFRHVASVALVLALVATGVLASTCLAGEPAGVETKGVVTVTMAAPCDMMFSEAHQQRYLTYLVKEFGPEALPDWEKAFADRKAASDKFGQMVESAQGSIEVTLPEGSSVQKGEVKIEMEPGQAGEGNKCFSISSFNAADKTQLDARMQVQKEFEDAVAKNDPAAIKNVLPKVLDDYRQGTEDMLKAVVNVK